MFFAKVIEIFFSLALFINALLFIPQALKIIRNQHADDVSLLTFMGFLAIQLLVIAHGILHHDKLLIIGTGLSLISCGAVVLLIIYFRIKTLKYPRI